MDNTFEILGQVCIFHYNITKADINRKQFETLNCISNHQNNLTAWNLVFQLQVCLCMHINKITKCMLNEIVSVTYLLLFVNKKNNNRLSTNLTFHSNTFINFHREMSKFHEESSLVENLSLFWFLTTLTRL